MKHFYTTSLGFNRGLKDIHISDIIFDVITEYGKYTWRTLPNSKRNEILAIVWPMVMPYDRTTTYCTAERVAKQALIDAKESEAMEKRTKEFLNFIEHYYSPKAKSFFKKWLTKRY